MEDTLEINWSLVRTRNLATDYCQFFTLCLPLNLISELDICPVPMKIWYSILLISRNSKITIEISKNVLFYKVFKVKGAMTRAKKVMSSRIFKGKELKGLEHLKWIHLCIERQHIELLKVWKGFSGPSLWRAVFPDSSFWDFVFSMEVVS